MHTLLNVHGAGSFAEKNRMQQSLLVVEERISPMV
jgi:hypothetical protein